jgi:hypothetical protein
MNLGMSATISTFYHLPDKLGYEPRKPQSKSPEGGC